MILVCDGYEDKYEKIGGIIKASYTDQGIRGFHVIDSDSTTFTLYQASRDIYVDTRFPVRAFKPRLVLHCPNSKRCFG